MRNDKFDYSGVFVDFAIATMMLPHENKQQMGDKKQKHHFIK